MLDTALHYRSSFEIKKSPISKAPTIFQLLVGEIRTWLSQHDRTNPANKELFQSWLYRGGSLDQKATGGAYRVEVRTYNYDGVRTYPDHWVLRFEHPDRSFAPRIWRVDLGVSLTNEESASVSVTISRYLKSGFIGEEPSAPAPSVPRFVKTFLEHEDLFCYSGEKRLRTEITRVTVSTVRDFYQFLLSSSRQLPVLLFNKRDPYSKLSYDELAKVLVGSCHLYWYDDADVHSALRHEWGVSADWYQCSSDAVRVYQPKIDLNHPRDSGRHRYFPLKTFSDPTKDLRAMLSKSLLRVAFNWNTQQIRNFEDLSIFSQKARLSQLRLAINEESQSLETKEYLAALETDNEQLTTVKAELIQKLQFAEDEIIEWQCKAEDADKYAKNIQDQFEEVSRSQSHLSKLEIELKELRQAWKLLPSRLEEVAQMVQTLNRDRLIFLPDAMKSAKDADFSDLHLAWELLMNMGTVLHDLYFGGCTNISREFLQRTGFEISLNEGSATAKNMDLMKLRDRVYEGKSVDVTPHAKLDKNGQFLRVHYYVDTVKELIVIGHCGGHLETVGSRVRGER